MADNVFPETGGCCPPGISITDKTAEACPLQHTAVMVDDTQQMSPGVAYQYGVYFVLMHNPLDLGDFGCRQDGLRFSGHDVAYGVIEELRLPPFHCAADVAVGDQSDDLAVRK